MNDVRDLLTRLADRDPNASAWEVLDGARTGAQRLRRRRTRRRIASVGTVAALVAVGIVLLTAGNGRAGSHVAVTPPPTTVPTVVSVPRYTVDATVLQNATHGPQICVLVETSLPPQCSGTPIANWDWKKVTAKETRRATTWGEYHLVGTYNGKVFSLTQTPGPRQEHPAPPSHITTPCPTPAGGWVVAERTHFTIDDFNAFTGAARAQPDFAGLWTDNSTPVDGRVNLFPEQVLTVAFTGNLDLHRTELRALWSGPICVVMHPISMARLTAIQVALTGATGRALGLQVVDASIDEVADVVNVDAVVATPAMQARVDRMYGRGVVRLSSVLTLVK